MAYYIDKKNLRVFDWFSGKEVFGKEKDKIIIDYLKGQKELKKIKRLEKEEENNNQAGS